VSVPDGAMGENVHATARVVGNALSFTVTDGTHTYTTSRTVSSVDWFGTVGLFHNGAPTQSFDNVQVYALQNAPFFADDFEAGERPEWLDNGTGTVASGGKLVANPGTKTIVSGVNKSDVRVTVQAVGNQEPGIILRYQDNGNFILADYNRNAKAIYYHEVVGGGYGGTLHWVTCPDLGTGDIWLTAEVRGSSLGFTITDGTHTYSTGGEIASVTWSGSVGVFHNDDGTQYFDNFVASDTNGGPAYAVPADAVQVVVPPSIATTTPVFGDYARIVGIAGQASATDGFLRSVTVRQPGELSKIPE